MRQAAESLRRETGGTWDVEDGGNMRHRINAIVAVVVGCLILGQTAYAQEVTPEQLQAKMDELIGEIKRGQAGDGSWGAARNLGAGGQWRLGTTALSILALNEAGVPQDDPALSNGLRYVLKKRASSVYEAGLKLVALDSMGHKKYVREMGPATTYLIGAQTASGGWGYSHKVSRTDNSCSQFAVLGLRSAARAGVKIPHAVWKRAWEYYARGQKQDGGWSYQQGGGNSYGSMTVAGVCSLYICAVRMHLAGGRCGEYVDDRRFQAGLRWLDKHFSVTSNPGAKGSYKFYYLYGLERAGVISARRYMGRRDWYLTGLRHLVNDPNAFAPRTERMEWPHIRHCFALLFLAKGNNPVLIHKAQWQGDWNPYRYDAKFMVEHVGEMFEQNLVWQIMPLKAPLDHVAAAPIVYVSGRGELRWTPTEIKRVKEYLGGGGFVLVEANGGDKAFDRSFRRMVAKEFNEENLSALSRSHPVYMIYHKIEPDDRIRLEGFQGPCVTSLVYCPGGMSCSWDINDTERASFKLGVNIIAYATGMEKLVGKIQRQQAPVRRVAPAQEAQFQGAFVAGQLVWPGAEPGAGKGAWVRLLGKANTEAGVSLFTEPIQVDAERDSYFRAHLLNISGARELRLGAEARAKLRRYVERGGFIFAEAACGSPAFDKSFRAVMADVFPDRPLTPLPDGHPLLKMGRRIGEVQYTQIVRKRYPHLNAPSLEHIELDGRAVVVYSKYDLSSAISGHPCRSCPAVLEPGASEIGLKIVLYSLAN